MATHAQRLHAVHVMDFMRSHKSHLLYPPGDQRTNRDNVSWHLTEQQLEHVLNSGGYWQGDCSEFCPYVLKCAGLWHWSQPGYTGSHLQLLPRYTDGKQARPGAIVVCGLDLDPNGKHEMIVHTADPKNGDPIVDSHGRPGLDRLRVSEIARGSLAGHVYLSIAHL
jgi:hypothetical protein